MYSVGPVQYHIALDGSVFALDKRRILKNNFSIQDQCPQGLSVNPLRKRLVFALPVGVLFSACGRC